jgi:hypothetical protein
MAPRIRVLPEKLPVAELLKNFLPFYETGIFINVFTKLVTGSYPKPDESHTYNPILLL